VVTLVAAAPPGAPPAPVYRPRHPERTALYRLLDRHFEAYRRVHADRFEPRSGPLRPEVVAAVSAFRDCGRLHGGFARIRCPGCGGEHLLAFSCRTRNLCPSCQAKRSAVFAERVVGEVLLEVAHRHVVFTVPKALRGLIERERGLHGRMARVAWGVIRDGLSEAAVEPDGVPGAVVSLQTFGSYGANFHPHLHAVVSA
jgi:ribosomal protein S27E